MEIYIEVAETAPMSGIKTILEKFWEETIYPTVLFDELAAIYPDNCFLYLLKNRNNTTYDYLSFHIVYEHLMALHQTSLNGIVEDEAIFKSEILLIGKYIIRYLAEHDFCKIPREYLTDNIRLGINQQLDRFYPFCRLSLIDFSFRSMQLDYRRLCELEALFKKSDFEPYSVDLLGRPEWEKSRLADLKKKTTFNPLYFIAK